VILFPNLPDEFPDRIPAKLSQDFKDRSKPLFLIYRKGAKLQTIEGVNTYALKAFVEEAAPSKADVAAEE
jgi:hypothetical protein